MILTDSYSEMLNIDELGEVKDLVENLNVELLKNHRIDSKIRRSKIWI